MGNNCCVSPQKPKDIEFDTIPTPGDRVIDVTNPSETQNNHEERTSPPRTDTLPIPELDAEQTIQQLLKTHPPGTKIIKALYDFEGDTREKI